ncbi:MAG: NifB/NifX family molybdenum-iron cluster-binding protein [Mobilitalea sp.]
MRIAFASIDGTAIDQHFGSARYWQIYDINYDGFIHITMRKTSAKCQGNCEGGFDHLLNVLDDCEAVFVAKIGQSAAAFMISKGIRVFEAAGSIEDIIAELQGGDFLE